jgi:hypothetical protein
MSRIFLTAFLATTLMTVFSYFYSAIRNKQYREPELLNILLNRLRYSDTFTIRHASWGWIVHYAIGLLFIRLYFLLWNVLDIEPSLMNCFILGAITGVVGIFGWKITFHLHPCPPEIKYDEFYFQLLIAHIVFGMGAYLSINLL